MPSTLRSPRTTPGPASPTTARAAQLEERSTDEAVVILAPATLPVLLTVDELAVLLRLNRKTVYAAIAAGEVPGVRRVGRAIRISREAVERWLASGVPKRRRRRAT